MSILGSYIDITNSKFDSLHLDEPVTSSSFHRAPFETPLICKVDLDNAVDRLGIRGRWHEWGKRMRMPPRGLIHYQTALAEYIHGEGNDVTEIVYELSVIM